MWREGLPEIQSRIHALAQDALVHIHSINQENPYYASIAQGYDEELHDGFSRPRDRSGIDSRPPQGDQDGRQTASRPAAAPTASNVMRNNHDIRAATVEVVSDQASGARDRPAPAPTAEPIADLIQCCNTSPAYCIGWEGKAYYTVAPQDRLTVFPVAVAVKEKE